MSLVKIKRKQNFKLCFKSEFYSKILLTQNYFLMFRVEFTTNFVNTKIDM